jgi:hypothetical protein
MTTNEQHPVVPRSDGERERRIRDEYEALRATRFEGTLTFLDATGEPLDDDATERAARLIASSPSDVFFLLSLLSDLREQVGRAQRDSERLDELEELLAEGRGPEFVPAEYVDHYLAFPSGFQIGSTGGVTLREAIDAAKSAAAARETGE